MKLFNWLNRRFRKPHQQRPAFRLDFELCEKRFLLTNFVVDSAADTDTGTPTTGTLRHVINELNATGTATNTIDFQIEPVGTLATINLTNGSLPAIEREVTIDGFSQGGTSNTTVLVQLNLNGNNGLIFDFFDSNGSTVDGLSIYGGGSGSFGITIFANDVTVTGNLLGIEADGTTMSGNTEGVFVFGSNNTISGANIIGANEIGIEISNSSATSNFVQGNFIGTNANGANLGNTGAGIMVDLIANNNTIGPNNVIGFNGTGVEINSGATLNVVLGNFIGTNASGANLGNTIDGVAINDSPNNTIGGTNTIGFNQFTGIDIIGSGSTGNVVSDNFIGTNAGDANLGNFFYGVLIDSLASNNTISGGNIIGFNEFGIDIAGSGVTGNVVLGNFIGTDGGGTNLGNTTFGVGVEALAQDNTIGANNVIGFNGTGVELNSGATLNVVLGNFIGTDSSGRNLGNTTDGVAISDSPSNTIGGANTIGFNQFTGIDIFGSGSTANVVLGNFIGTDASGANLGNSFYGVLIDGLASNNTISGGNIIGFNQFGIDIAGSGVTGNVVLGNFIGTDGGGGTNLGNTTFGVGIEAQAQDNTIGPNNVIGFNGTGVEINSGATLNVVLGNFIGTDSAGRNLGNTTDGVAINDSPSNSIGGANTIGFNQFTGIDISGSGATANVVLGNFIGTNASGGNLGNSFYGVLIDGLATNNTISGANVIGFNQFGIDIAGSGVTGNVVLGNFIGTNSSVANLGNTTFGVGIEAQAQNNTIGPNNVIGFNGTGVEINSGATLNVVLGNFIGTDSAGRNMGNTTDGVAINDSPSNSIGGANTIGFNQFTGIDISGSGSTANVVLGNFIGTNAGGGNLGNSFYGVLIDGLASNNTISGANIIGFNQFGIDIAGPGATGNVVLGNFIGTNSSVANLGNTTFGVGIEAQAQDNTIGPNNVIGFNGTGVEINSGATLNVVLGNFIGTDSGAGNLGNTFDGVAINDSPSNTIGGTNTIGFNQFTGIDISGSGATANVVLGNFIGTNTSGANLGNTFYGVLIDGLASNNTISGGNIIGFNQFGIDIAGSGVTGNVVLGNFIGTNSSGANLGNTTFGVGIEAQAQDNTIGPNNVIGFNGTGVEINSGATLNVVLGNFVGTDSGGGNLGNTIDGVAINDSPNNSIGGANTIGFNHFAGIDISGSGSTANVVSDNLIGSDASGAHLGNSFYGVLIDGLATNNTISGANIIGFNQLGIDIAGPGVTGNVVLGSFIGTNSSGANLGNSQAGVSIDSNADHNTVGPGNVIGFNNAGIDFSSGATANVVLGNFIGTDASGASLGNTNGVSIIGSANNSIGGANTIGHNLFSGIDISGSGATGNLVQGNFIGTNAGGANLGNTVFGVLINGLAASNTISGANTIGFNPTGIAISGAGVTGNVVRGNFVGTNASGANLGNTVAGVLVTANANHTTIGPANTVGFNGIGIDFSSGATANVVLGNFIGTDAIGTSLHNVGPGVLISGASNNTIGGTASGLKNVIANNGGNGITVTGDIEGGAFVDATGNRIIGNLIGTNGAGTKALGNAGAGVLIQYANGNIIGPGDTISGNGQSGIELFGGSVGGVFRGATSNTIVANFIGTNLAGTAAVPNVLDGIMLTDAARNSITGNVVSGNGANDEEAAGIDILNANSTGNTVAGNKIGTDVSGSFAIGNSLHGVFVGNGASFNVIGPGNVISGSGGSLVQGVGVYVDGTATQGNSIIGNVIGTNAAGTAAIAGSSVGVLISNAPNNTVGGLNDGDRNIISGNSVVGVYIALAGATGNVVENNYIGADRSGFAGIPNGVDGIYINAASGNLIGGTSSAAGNLISANLAAGIQILGQGATGNQIIRNRFGLNANGRPTLPNRVTGIFSQVPLQANDFGFKTVNQNLGQVAPWQSPHSINSEGVILARKAAKAAARKKILRARQLAKQHHAPVAHKTAIGTAVHGHPHAKLAVKLSRKSHG